MELIDLLNRSRQQLILTPAKVRDLYELPANGIDRSAFKVHTNEMQEEFLTVWPIIRDNRFFERMVSALTTALTELRSRIYFNRIVTSTPTMRYFLEAVSYRLNDPIDVIYFDYLGIHPLQSLGLPSTRSFSNRDFVVLITDVVSSGNLLGDMQAVVEHLGANIVGAVSLFDVDYVEHVGRQARFEDRQDTIAGMDRGEHRSLFLSRLKRAETGAGYEDVIPINRATVYPAVDGFSDTDFEPIVPFNALLRAQKRRSFASLGTFSSNEKWISIAFDVGVLLRAIEDQIVPGLLQSFDLATTTRRPATRYIVTTPNHENRTFVNFIARQLRRRGHRPKILFIPRSETLSEQYSYFAPEALNVPDGETVYLCLATVNTSEKLRALAAHLAMSNIKSIKVLTLVNRMSSLSGSFLSRVLNLHAGHDRRPRLLADLGMFSEFRYSSVLKIYDFSPQDLMRAHSLAAGVIRTYKRRCQSYFFQDQAENELKYFQPTPVSAVRFEHRHLMDVSGSDLFAERLAGLEFDPARVPESIVYSLCTRDVLDCKSFDLVYDALSVSCSKELSYALVRIILLNASLLKVTGEYHHLLFLLLERTRHLEERKRALVGTSMAVLQRRLNSKSAYDRIESKFAEYSEEQARCLCVLAFLATLGISDGDKARARDTILAILSVEGQGNAFASLLNCTNSYLLWSITFLSSAFDIRETIEDQVGQLATAVRREVAGTAAHAGARPIFDILQAIDPEGESWGSYLLANAAAYAEAFEVFFGRSAKRSLRVSMRALVAQIEKDVFPERRIRHAIQFRNIENVDTSLNEIVDARKLGPTYTLRFTTDARREDVKFELTSCQWAVSQLQLAAPYIERLIESDNAGGDWTEYFVSSGAGSRFEQDLKQLQEIVNRVRQSYVVSSVDMRDMAQLRSDIMTRLWSRQEDETCGSDLFKHLRAYELDLQELLSEAILHANESIKRDLSISDFWSVEQVEGGEIPPFHGFGERAEFLRAMVNALENATHALKHVSNADQIPSIGSVRFRVGEMERHSVLMVEILTHGREFVEEAWRAGWLPTWRSQNQKLGRYGGAFSYEPVADPEVGAIATISIASSPLSNGRIRRE